MTAAMALAVPWEEGHSVPCDGTATADPADSAAAAAAAPEKASPRTPWRGLWQAERMRWTKCSDASSGSHATAAAGRGSESSSRRRACTATGTARNRTGVADGRNSAGSGRGALGSLAVRRKRLGDSAENLRLSWSEQLFGTSGAERRLEWVRCGPVSGRCRGAAVEAVADPSCWGRPSPRGRRENRTGAGRWRIIRATGYKHQTWRLLLFFFAAADEASFRSWSQGKRAVSAGVGGFVGLGCAIACGINTRSWDSVGAALRQLNRIAVGAWCEAAGRGQMGWRDFDDTCFDYFALQVANKDELGEFAGIIQIRKHKWSGGVRVRKGSEDRHQPNMAC